MDFKGAMNRGNNLLMSGFLAVLGFGLVPEILRESEWIDRADNIVLLVLAIATSGWYLYGNNRTLRSLVPFGLLVIALITKFAALTLEFTDPDAVGDEFGVIPVLFLIVALSGYLLFAKRGLES